MLLGKSIKCEKRKKRKQTMRLRALMLTIVTLSLILFHGCSPHILGVEGQETFPIYSRPDVPVLDWHMCQIQFMCLTVEEYDNMRMYVIKMDGLVNAYERQTNIINRNE